MTTYSDDELRLFLHGDLPEAKQAEIVKVLERDAAFEQRLMALDDLGPVVAAGFASVGPQKTFDTAPRAKALSRGWGVAMAACVAGLAAYGATAFFNRAADVAPWMQQVAVYQALYSPQTIAHIKTDPSERAIQLRRAETALDLDLRKDQLAAVDGLTLIRAQLLAFEGQPLTQIVFADDAGQPIALCILETGHGADAIAFAQLEGLESARFSADGYSFLLIGPTQAAAMADYATAFEHIFSQS